ncbi:alpha/beta hydrolase family esterase [Nannocystis punicea]|uniref:Prolyl oligopeptidase family serine peptidase n=1 Tax=Nannocystis punicea TaxID=2995304 RepID=A0ABY7GSG8_9BACT|nr:prolyl oligopeptidase family serine peptidase [Nannocystis poenicansa]WAS89814.1 prolyl oligopeptidase family serine peptidase [Nannocystis poenicansa]
MPRASHSYQSLVTVGSLALLLALGACSGADDESGESSEGTGSDATTTTTDATTTTTATTGPDAPTTTSPTTDSSTTTSSTTDPGTTTDGTTGDPLASPGCGLAPPDPPDGINVMIDAGPEGDGMRRFYLRRSPDYDPNVPHRLIFGFAGTDWVGDMIEPYFGLQGDDVEPMPDEIFVYPDPLWRDFEGWGNYGGWVLGPYAAPADGDQDLVFVEAVIDYMAANYCIDRERVFATGHSWGGDMAHVVACFLGDKFRAAVPVAANSPYWFDDGGTFIDCVGDAAVWTMFGQADDHFNSQQQGLECRDFWLDERGCDGLDAAVNLDLGDAPDECVEYQGCSATTRFCLYGAQYAHQIPGDYFAAATMAFFRSF